MKRLLIGGVVAAMLLAALGSAPAVAAPAAPTASSLPKPVGFSAVTTAAAASTTEYWTPARMAQAKPADIVRPGRPGAGKATPPVSARRTGGSGPAAGSEGLGSGGPTAQAAGVAKPYTDLPDRLNGKVYFDKYTLGGSFVGHYVCSGTSVNSPGKSLVWTAGHCVHGGFGHQVHRNWTFVPAYSSGYNGHRPYKTWAAKELWTLSAWANSSDFSYDLGAVIVHRVDTVRLTDKIGGQGIWFGVSPVQSYRAYGYPAESPFTGFLQYQCISPSVWSDDPGSGPDTLGIVCDMTGGSSGGGWVYNQDSNGLGRVNSVNSYGYASQPNRMYGPYHGDAGLDLYNYVKNKTA